MAAAKTWNVDRQKGGSYEFSLDASGNYVLNSVGFNQVKTLNLPELKKETPATLQPIDTKKASEQTKEAFGDVQPFYYDKKGSGGDQYTSQYKMKKEGDLATDQTMTKGAWDTGKWGPKPGDTTPITTKKADTIPVWAQGVDKRGYENINKDISVKATDQIGRRNIDQVLAKRAQQKDLNRFPGMVGPQKPSPYQDAIMRGERGVKYEKPGVPQKTTELTNTALKAVKSTSNVLSKALGFVMDNTLVGKVLGAFKETDQHKHDKNYFSKTNGILDNGRIAGNASTNVFAGLNSVSAFGNLSKAAANRIATRNKTIATKNVSQKFIDDTKNMEKEQKDHATSQAAAKNKKDLATGGVAPGASGGGGGAGGTRVICTYFYSKNQFSLIDLQLDTEFSRNNLSDEVKIGYWFWAIPLVDWMKKHENSNNWWVKLVKNSTKLFAQERAKEIAYTMGKKNKGSLIGKFVRLFGETGCYILGTLIKPFVFDKYKIFLTEYQKDVNLRGEV